MLIFAGDINLTDWIFNVGFGVGSAIKKGLDPFKYFERRKEDLWIGNFEGVASSSSSNNGIYAKAFRIAPDVLRKLNHMNMYGFANNHAMEHGSKAYMETVEALESYGSKVFGLRERKSILFEHQGQNFSITGMSLRIEATKNEPLYWHNPEYYEVKKELASLPSDTFKILYVHWGCEYINRPSSSQKKLAHLLIDSGFDLIIGMHPHVLQGYEDYKGRRIYYSLGNCVFDMPSDQCKIGALVGLDFNNGYPVYSEQYLVIDDESCPRLVSESEIPSVWHFNYLNDKLTIEDNPEEYCTQINKGYHVYRHANRKRVMSSAFSHPKTFVFILADFIKRKIIR